MNQSKPDKLMPALAGGAFLGVASALPYLGALNCACCSLVIGGGFLSVFIFKRRSPEAFMTSGDGALLGLLSGLVGSVVFSILNALISGAQAGGAELREQIERAIASDPNFPPQLAEFLRSLTAGGAAGVGLLLLIFVIALVLFSIFGTVGGILGVAILQKKPPQTPPAQWSQPQPPGSYQPPPPPYQPPPPPSSGGPSSGGDTSGGASSSGDSSGGDSSVGDPPSGGGQP